MTSAVPLFVRYARDLPGFLRDRLDPARCRALVVEGLATRAESLRSLVAGGVFAVPGSPWFALMRHAGVTLGDVEHLIRTEGPEGALATLHDAGVYATLEEFKGTRPIRRGSLELAVGAEAFDNPLRTAHFAGSTGGSSGMRRRLLVDLAMLTTDAACYHGFQEAWGIAPRPMAVWRPVPPDNSGIKKLLVRAKLGQPVARWFTQNRVRWRRGDARYAAFTRFTLAAARMLGHAFPRPEHVPLDRADVVARWLAEQVRAGAPAHLDTLTSSAVRACVVARDLGAHLHGTFFRVGGEPLTDAKARLIEAAGATASTHYAMSETGPIAMGCAHPQAFDDTHVLESKVLLTTHRRAVAAFAEPVDAIHLTTISRSSPKVMLNVETGDCGTLVRRECGCTLGAWGLGQHLHTIRSWEKLTSEGITFLGSSLVELLDEVLPRSFGGAPLDYQLLEEEEGGLTRVSIVVAPRVGPIDEARVVDVALGHLAGRDSGHRLMTSVWRDGTTLRVVRREPVRTVAGKVLPLHVAEKR